MKFLYILIPILLLILLRKKCAGSVRKNHPKGEHFRTVLYAHRGLHDETKPENSLAAFASAVGQGYSIELDVHLTKDGELLVMHDNSLLRTCGVDLKVCEHTLEELRRHPLPDGSAPPTFEEVLRLVNGKSALLIELKFDGNNAKPLVKRVLKALEGYQGDYCFESFDPRIVRQLKRQCPTVYRGQLSNDYMRYKGPYLFKLLLTSMFFNLFNRPDFVSFNIEFKDCKALKASENAGGDVFFWTVRSREEYEYCKEHGYGCIFENFIP